MVSENERSASCHPGKIDLDRFESFEIVSGCLGHFRPFLHCLGIFRSFQVLEKENLSLFPEK